MSPSLPGRLFLAPFSSPCIIIPSHANSSPSPQSKPRLCGRHSSPISLGKIQDEPTASKCNPCREITFPLCSNDKKCRLSPNTPMVYVHDAVGCWYLLRSSNSHSSLIAPQGPWRDGWRQAAPRRQASPTAPSRRCWGWGCRRCCSCTRRHRGRSRHRRHGPRHRQYRPSS